MSRSAFNEPGDRFDKALAEEKSPTHTRCPCHAICKCRKRLAGDCDCHRGGDDDQ